MNAQATNTETVVKKESKNKIRVDFERTSFWTRFRLKYLSFNFLMKVIWAFFRYAFLIGVSYVILFPFFSKIAGSFMSPEDFVDVTVKLIPKYPTLTTYRTVIAANEYYKALTNTALLSVVTALMQTFMCCVIGYGFAKFKFRGNKLLFAMVLLTMIVPHKTLQLSMYMQFKYFDFFGILNLFGLKDIDMINTYFPMGILSLTGLAFKNGLYIFMMRQFFRGVPDELEESAYIDGSGVFRTFVRIIIPLSIPMMITIFLFAFSWQWTDTFYTDMFFTSQKTWMLPDIVSIPKSLNTNYAGGNLYSSAIRNTCGLLIIAPLLIIYLFCQRYLIQGIERSGIVG